MFFPGDNCSHPLATCGQELLMLISVHTLPVFGTPCVYSSQAVQLCGAVWLVLTRVRRDDACLLRCRSVHLFSPFLFPCYSVEWREEPGGSGKERVHKMEKAWCSELLYGWISITTLICTGLHVSRKYCHCTISPMARWLTFSATSFLAMPFNT